MIFLTLGTQLPFDRLTKALDETADKIEEPIFGQIGFTDFKPVNFEFVHTLEPAEFSRQFSRARVIVAHAGIGTILSAKKAEKPLIIMARKAALGEHRNDHQTATCGQMKNHNGIYVAENGNDLLELLTRAELPPMQQMDISPAKLELINNLRLHLNTGC